MQIEKRRSKGSFLQFFDWNSKSRKKLFLNGGNIPGGSSQGIEDGCLSANSRITNAANGSGTSPGNERNNDWNCASSETSNDGYESKAPGVVARLMGLDSLPSSSVTDNTSTSSDGFRPLKVSSDSLLDKYDPNDYLGSSSRLAGFPSTLVEAKVQKARNWPLERFQTVALPPKSAKSISAARHKLFSPVRSPGMFPAKNPEYIIEAAAKILEASPRIMGDRLTSSISASAPLRIQDLKAKLEAAYEASKCQIYLEPNSARNVGRKPADKEYCGLEDTHNSRTAVPLRKSNSDSGRYKGKSPMTAGKATGSVQRREEKSQLSQRNIGKSRDENEGNSNRIPRQQLSTQRTSQKNPPVNKRTMVLRQNNQKQNSLPNGPYSTSRGLGSKQQLLRVHSANGSKTVNMVNTRYAQNNMKKPPSNARNACSSSRANPLPLNKGSSSLDSQTMRSTATNILIANAVSRSKNDSKKGMDVISFTFNSPIKKCARESPSDGQNMGRDCRDAASNVDNCMPSLRESTSSSPTQSIINGNSLSILLEQKLRELTSRIQSSDFETAAQESICSSTRSMEETASAVIARLASAGHEKGFHEVPDEDMNSPFSFVSSSTKVLEADGKQMPKDGVSRDLEGVDTTATSIGSGQEVDFQQPSPVSILEPSFESRSLDGISPNDESKECSSSSPGKQEMFKWLCTREVPAPDDESEFSYSSCSSFRTEFDSKHAVSCSMSSNGSRNWELAYIEDVIGNVGLILTEVLLTPRKESERTSQFEELEDWMNRTGEYEDQPKDRRKLIFDCAAECVESRCRHVFAGTNRSWDECARMFESKTWFVDDVYREVTSRKGKGDMLVDELVDADMSSRQGKWIEFNAEMYEEGVKIGKGILVSLIDELVTDFCCSQSP